MEHHAPRSDRSPAALIVRGSWREVLRQTANAARYRVPPDVDVSTLDPPALIALADKLNADRAA